MVAYKKRIKKLSLNPVEYLSVDQMAQLGGFVCRRALSRRKGTYRAAVNEMIIVLLMSTGLRAEELCDLKVRNMPCFHGKNEIYVECGKNRKARTIPVQAAISERIKRFVSDCRKHAKPGSYFIVNERGGKLSYRSLYSKVVLIGRAAKLKGIGMHGRLHPHILRHTYLTHFQNACKDRQMTQRVAGHKDPRTTDIYTHVIDTAHNEAVERLNINAYLTQL